METNEKRGIEGVEMPGVGLTKRLWMGGVSGYLLGRNLAFKHAPGAANALMRWSNVSGRGRGRDGAEAARYFASVLRDYEIIAQDAGLVTDPKELFRGRRVLELGPGNTRSITLSARVRGATMAAGWDAFDVQSRDETYLRPIYEALLADLGEPGGFPRALELTRDIRVHKDAETLRAAGTKFDLVLSRAVLEHVRDVDRLYGDLEGLLSDDAVLIHKVDLRCHGFRLNHELDFLLFPERVWRRLTTHIGEPNRVRYPDYLAVGEKHGFVPVYASSTHVIPLEDARRVRKNLAVPFRDMADDVLSVLGFWMVQVRKGHPLAARGAAATPIGPAPHARLGSY